METRRDFLKLSGLAAASAAVSSCGFGSGSSGASGSWSSRDLSLIEATAGTNAARGWAVWQDGRRLSGWNTDTRAPALSITKSIAALAATRAAAEGWLSPSERVAETIPEWRGDPRKSTITIRMLLQQVSGLEAGVIQLYRNHPADKGRAAIALGCVDTPGSTFRYGPGHWETLAEVMRRKLAARKQSLATFMQRAVMGPVGLSPWNWRSDKLQTPYFSTGTELDVKELGRLGRVIGKLLSGNDSDGFSASHYQDVVRPSAANPMFGGGLWHNANVRRPGAASIRVEGSIDSPLGSAFWSRACLSTRQPGSMVALIGSGGKRVYIWPGSGKCIARIGASTSWSDAGFLGNLQG